MLSGRGSLALARVVADGLVVQVDRDHLHAAGAGGLRAERDPDARLHLRRVALIASGEAELLLLGSRHSAPTLRLKAS